MSASARYGMQRLGQSGDSAVAPVLLDVARPTWESTGPPSDAVDVQFRIPRSLSALLDTLHHAREDRVLRLWSQGYDDLLSATLERLQRDGGYVDDGRGGARPARLEIAPVVEGVLVGTSTTRWHAHVYVNPTARCLLSGRRWPLAWDELRESVHSTVWPYYAGVLRKMATDILGVTWAALTPGGPHEVVTAPWSLEPPRWNVVCGDERGVCPGPWGHRRLLLADERHLRLARGVERDLERAEAEGRSWGEPPLYEPPVG